MQILILAGSQGNSGEHPLFLAEIGQKTLIERIIKKCTKLNPRSIQALVLQANIQKYRLESIANQINPQFSWFPLRTSTAGAACSALLAVDTLDPEEELLIISANELIDTSYQKIVNSFRERDADAGVVSFQSMHPRYSFARLEGSNVVEVAEKHPISMHALAGFTWFKKTKFFIDGATAMLLKDASVNGLFYVATVLNELILNNQRVTAVPLKTKKYHPLKSADQLAHEVSAH